VSENRPPVAKTLEEANEIIARLWGEVLRLTAEVAELKARLDLNSSNSSKPPSSDPPGFKRKPPEKPSGKKPGGQPGHEGQARKILPPEKVTRSVDVRPDRCADCGARIGAKVEGKAPVVHQQIELPNTPPEVTQYNLFGCECPRCGAWSRAGLPPGVSPSPFGPRLQAAIAMLTVAYGLSRRDVKALLHDLWGIDISLGAVQGACETVSEAVAPAVEQVHAEVVSAPAVHADETGWKEKSLRRWLWNATTPDAEMFMIEEGRGAQALGCLLPETFRGVVHSDRWRPYGRFAVEMRQLCHAHLRRDFQALIDRGGEARTIGEKFLARSDSLFKVWHAFKRGKIDRKRMVRRMRGVQISWGRSVSSALGGLDSKARALGKDLHKDWHALWTFVYVEGVEPTNNDAERALRKAVILRKTSFGTKSATGSAFIARMLTVVGTARRRGIDLLAWLTHACHAAANCEPPPLLNPC
jgi:transposase